MKRINPRIISPLKKFGAKFYMMPRIVPILEYRPIFIEGFAATSVISLNIDEKFDKHICVDKDVNTINFWKVLKQFPDRLIPALRKIKYCEENFASAKQYLADNKDINEPVYHAMMKFVANRMSRAADEKTFGWSDRARRGMPEYISAFKSTIDSLSRISDRIQTIDFVCDDYINFMIYEGYDRDPLVCTYQDPPYLHSTRSVCRPYGEYEMSDDDHRKLLEFNTNFIGVVYLSGYSSELYNEKLYGYKKHEWLVANSSSQEKKKPRKFEILWEIR